MQNFPIEIQNPTRLTSFQNKTKSQAMEFLFKPFFYIFLFLYKKYFSCGHFIAALGILEC